MKTIEKEVTNEIIIQKSAFITNIFPLSSFNEISLYLEQVKNKHKDANHHCYAYIYDSYKRCSDDSEPSGTAGMPILNVLEKKELNRVLCIVTRYFGGIKLGAGGLVRAYSSSASEALKQCNIIPIIKYFEFTISFPYEHIKTIDKILEAEIILNKNFQELVTYQVKIKEENIEKIKEKLKHFTLL